MKEVSIFVTYCDDVRAEVGGKHSLMGVYNAEMFLPSLPATLPKLCANAVLNIPSTLEIDSIAMRAYANDQQIAEEIIPGEAIPELRAFVKTMERDPAKWLGLNVTFVFSPLTVENATKIRVSGIVNGEETKGNALQIRVPTEAEATAVGLSTITLPTGGIG